jgi:hypothetical protein
VNHLLGHRALHGDVGAVVSHESPSKQRDDGEYHYDCRKYGPDSVRAEVRLSSAISCLNAQYIFLFWLRAFSIAHVNATPLHLCRWIYE